MKRISLAFICLFSAMFFTSCDPGAFDELLEQKPNIVFIEEEGYAMNNNTVYTESELRFKIKAWPNETSGKPLKTYLFVINDSNGTILHQESRDLTGSEAGEMEFIETYIPKTPMTLEITATVTDEVGKKNTATMVITAVLPPTEDEVIGTFFGNIKINCDVTSDTPAIDGNQINIEEKGEMRLSATADNQAQASFTIDNTEIILTGIRNGNKFTFDQFEYSTVVSLVMDIDIVLNINMVGVLEDGVLTVEGDVEGHGSTLFNMVQATLLGNIEGEMTLEEE